MKPHFRTFAVLATIATLVASPGPASAQSVDAGIIAMTTSHDLMSDGLFGFGARIEVGLGSRIALHAGAEHATGTARRPGILCVGLVQPGTCTSEEQVRDNARLTTAVGGFDARLLGAGSRSLSLTGDVRIGVVRVVSTGASTGRQLTDEKSLIGGELGLQAIWSLTPHSPFALVLAGSAGEMRPIVKEQVIDGYNPFWTDFNVGRLRAGGRWTLQ